MNIQFSVSPASGRRVENGRAVYPNAKIFHAGDYPDKSFSMTPDEIASAIASFSPVSGNIEHTSFLKGRACHISRVWADDGGKELRGEVSLPLGLDELMVDNERKLSAEWDRDAKKLSGIALTVTPRVLDAVLMNADFANTRHNTPEGQTVMQDLHDTAARAGAVCDKKNANMSNANMSNANMSNANMSSQHEATAVQKIHDIAADHGADCSKGEKPDWAKSVYSSFVQSSVHPNKTTPNKTTPKPASPKSAKGEKSMSIKDTLKALFSSAGVPEADIETHLTPEAVAAFTPASAGMTEGEKAQFAALLEKNARLEAAAIEKDAAAFADGAIQEHRAYPAERASLIALFTQAATDDQAAPAKITFSADAAGQPVTGSRVDALAFAVKSLPAHGLTSEQVETAAFTGGILAARSGATETDKINAQVEKLLASTGIGQQIAAEKAKKG